MRKVLLRKEAVFAIVVIVSILMLSGCSCLSYKPIPVKNAAIGINVKSGGKIEFVGRDGEVRDTQNLSLVLKKISRRDPKTQDNDYEPKPLQKIATINVWAVKGSIILLYEANGETVCDVYEDDGTYRGPCP